MPNFSGIDHIAITVSDLDVSVPFYERMFGMPSVGALDGVALTRRVFRMPSGTTIGLTQHERAADGPFSPFHPGLDHIGFGCADGETLEQWRDHLDAVGIANSGLVQADYGTALSFTDPDGTALEFFVGANPN